MLLTAAMIKLKNPTELKTLNESEIHALCVVMQSHSGCCSCSLPYQARPVAEIRRNSLHTKPSTAHFTTQPTHYVCPHALPLTHYLYFQTRRE